MTTPALQKYIALSRQFRAGHATQKTAAPLHAFIDELRTLEQTPQIKTLLAETYSLLGYHKSAHEIFAPLADPANRKDVARLFKMRQMAESHGDTFALKPERTAAPEIARTLPVFKYLPDPLGSGIFKDDAKAKCDCCEKQTAIYYDGPTYAKDNIRTLCPVCIHSGKAAEKFNAMFQQDLVNDERVTDKTRTDEVLHRTPGYISFQGNAWPAHCDDYCAFVAYVGWPEIEEMNLAADLENLSGFKDEALHDMRNNGSLQGYLFRCLCCGKPVLLADCD